MAPPPATTESFCRDQTHLSMVIGPWSKLQPQPSWTSQSAGPLAQKGSGSSFLPHPKPQEAYMRLLSSTSQLQSGEPSGF